jgi:hypothetical protein
MGIRKGGRWIARDDRDETNVSQDGVPKMLSSSRLAKRNEREISGGFKGRKMSFYTKRNN